MWKKKYKYLLLLFILFYHCDSLKAIIVDHRRHAVLLVSPHIMTHNHSSQITDQDKWPHRPMLPQVIHSIGI